MTALLLGSALLLALAASGWRALGRRRVETALAALPGGSRATALAVDDFGAIDAHLAARRCRCGGRLRAHGERSESAEGARVLRVVRVECGSCERRGEVWFDASRIFH